MDYPFYVHDIGKIPDELLKKFQDNISSINIWKPNQLFRELIVETVNVNHTSKLLVDLSIQCKQQLNELIPASSCISIHFNRLQSKKFIVEHSDINTQFSTNPMRFVLNHKIHIPLTSNSLVTNEFRRSKLQEKKTFYLEPGRCYLYNDYVWHGVYNNSNEDRVHLLLKYSDPEWILRRSILEKLGYKLGNTYEVI